MNEFYEVTRQLIPFFLLILIVVIIVFVVYLISMVINITKTLKEANKVVEKIDLSVEKLQGPLDTINNISKTVDTVQLSTLSFAKKTAGFVFNNLTVLSKMMDKLFGSKKRKNKVKNEESNNL